MRRSSTVTTHCKYNAVFFNTLTPPNTKGQKMELEYGGWGGSKLRVVNFCSFGNCLFNSRCEEEHILRCEPKKF